MSTSRTISAGVGGITQLTGDVTAGPGSGSQVATIPADTVTNAKLADMAAHTVKVNITGGSANPTDETWLATLNAEVNSANGSVMAKNAAGAFGVTGLGDASKYLDSTGAFSQPAATGGTNWVTLFDTDFSAQSNQTLTADGTYTIGGLTWTKVNSANDNVAMAVVNGSGLRIQPKNSEWFGATRTAPAIELDVLTYLPSYYMDMPIRLWVYLVSHNIAATGDKCGIAMDNLGTTSTGSQAVNYHGWSAAKAIISGGFIGPTAAGSQVIASPLNTTDNALVMTLPIGRYGGYRTNYAGTYSSGWPALSVMVPKLLSQGGTQTQSTAQDIVTSLPMKIVVTATRVTTALDVTIGRIRVDYKVQ